MGKPPRVLFVSNGYGEDTVAARIAKCFAEFDPGYDIRGFPTVGAGNYYTESGIELAGRGPELPSEGFVRSPRDFFIDVKNGFVLKTVRMGLELRRASRDADLLVAVGDPYLLLFSSLFTGLPREKKIFVGTLQSELYGSKRPFKEHYSFIERRWLSRFSSLVIVRDVKTRDYLLERGLKRVFTAGNPMMDCFETEKARIFSKGTTLIGVLPGSKREAYDNFSVILGVLKRLRQHAGGSEKISFAVAFPLNLDERLLAARYRLTKVPLPEFVMRKKTAAMEAFRTEDGGVEFVLSKRIFGNLLSESRAIIGISGTGNEQAVGMGKPVFACWGKGPQFTRRFAVAQKRLLGISLFVFPPDPDLIAKKMTDVLGDKKLLEEVSTSGTARMAGRGSIAKIAREIDRHAKEGANLVR
jgi:uncharacterized protein (TIGR03492 family)